MNSLVEERQNASKGPSSNVIKPNYTIDDVFNQMNVVAAEANNGTGGTLSANMIGSVIEIDDSDDEAMIKTPKMKFNGISSDGSVSSSSGKGATPHSENNVDGEDKTHITVKVEPIDDVPLVLVQQIGH